jgi:hypothetical protein
LKPGNPPPYKNATIYHIQVDKLQIVAYCGGWITHERVRINLPMFVWHLLRSPTGRPNLAGGKKLLLTVTATSTSAPGHLEAPHITPFNPYSTSISIQRLSTPFPVKILICRRREKKLKKVLHIVLDLIDSSLRYAYKADGQHDLSR